MWWWKPWVLKPERKEFEHLQFIAKDILGHFLIPLSLCGLNLKTETLIPLLPCLCKDYMTRCDKCFWVYCLVWHAVAPHKGYQRWWWWDWKAQPEEQALKPGLMIPETLVGALPVEKRESGWSKLRDCQPQIFINGQQWSIKMSPCQDFRTTSFYNLRKKKLA